MSCCQDGELRYSLKKINWAVLLLAFVLVPRALGAGERLYVGTPQFEKMKSLEGAWEAVDPKNPDEKLFSEFHILENGRKLEEKSFVGTGRESASVYFENDGKLLVTITAKTYSPVPFEYRYARYNEYIFILAIGSGIKPDEPHLHERDFSFIDRDHIDQKWIYFDAGKPKETTVLKLTRVRGQEPVRESKKAAKKRREKEDAEAQARESAKAEEMKKARESEEARKAAEAAKAEAAWREAEAKKAEKMKEAEEARKAEEDRKSRVLEEKERVQKAEEDKKAAELKKAENARKAKEASRPPAPAAEPSKEKPQPKEKKPNLAVRIFKVIIGD